MTYFVNLVQRGVSANTHAVSGKSGKEYGTAVNSPAHGGVILRMSLQDYMNAAHDLCGNTMAGQQWVPEFVMETGAQAQARPKCDRCPKPSVAIWDRFTYCAEHAPANATWYDESERTSPPPAASSGPNTSDVLPRVVEPLTPGVTDPKQQRDLPREKLAPAFIGSDAENSGATGAAPPPKVLPEQTGPTGPSGTPGSAGTAPITETGPTGVSGATQPPPAVASEKVEPVAQHQEPNAVSVVSAITKGVIAAVMPQLERMIDDRLTQKPAPPAPPKRDHRKKANPSRPGPASEFQKLQQEAKGLGINSFGMNRERLEAAIAAKKGEASNGATPE